MITWARELPTDGSCKGPRLRVRWRRQGGGREGGDGERRKRQGETGTMAALPNLSLGTDPNFTAMCSMFPKDRTGWRDKTVSEERRKNSGKFLKDITE